MAPSCFMITLIFLPKLSNILKTWQSISKKKFSLPSVGWICRSSGMADGETEKRREKNQGKINHTPEARRWSLFLSFGWFHTTVVGRLGMPTSSKTDEFSEKFQTAFDPPPLIFGKLCCKFFPKFMTEVSSVMAKICNINFWIENDPL